MISKVLNRIKKIMLYKKIKSIGCNVTIKGGQFGHPENITIGNDVYIGPESYWDALGGIDIKDNVIIGPKSIIWTYNHNFKNAQYLPYDEIEILENVVIEENVWIGIGVSIKPGTHIGEGAIVAMGSVVTKNIPKFAIVGGNPAKIISYRDETHYYQLKKDKQFYLSKKNKLVKKYMVKN